MRIPKIDSGWAQVIVGALALFFGIWAIHQTSKNIDLTKNSVDVAAVAAYLAGDSPIEVTIENQQMHIRNPGQRRIFDVRVMSVGYAAELNPPRDVVERSKPLGIVRGQEYLDPGEEMIVAGEEISKNAPLIFSKNEALLRIRWIKIYYRRDVDRRRYLYMEPFLYDVGPLSGFYSDRRTLHAGGFGPMEDSLKKMEDAERQLDAKSLPSS